MSDAIGNGEWKAGFYYDLKFLIALTSTLLIAAALIQSWSSNISEITLVFLSLLIFLDLQEFIEVKVPRYGWQCSRLYYKLAYTFLLLGVLFIPTAGYLMNNVGMGGLPTYTSILFFFILIGLNTTPLVGIAFALTCYLDFANALKTSLWKRDKEISEVLSKHSYFYRTIFRHQKKEQR